MFRVLSRASKSVGRRAAVFLPSFSVGQPSPAIFSGQLHPLLHENPIKFVAGQLRLFHNSSINSSPWDQFGFASSTFPETSKKENESDIENNNRTSNGELEENNGDVNETQNSEDTDSEAEGDVAADDLVKLAAEKEELLKSKHKEIEIMQDKVLRAYAEMENVMERTKREAENSKKFAIQNFAKALLDVADNLARASSVVKDSFSKVDTSNDLAGVVLLLRTLLEGVEMTEKQLAEVFKKFGVEKYDPIDETFDPHRHNAIFQAPDPSRPPGAVAVVLKPGYTLYDRIIRPAEVGVTPDVEMDERSKE